MAFDGLRPLTLMMKREFDGERRCTHPGELSGSDFSMVPVKEHSPGKRKPEKHHDRRDSASDHPKTGMAFSDVVHQRRCNDIAVAAAIRNHTQSGVMSVTLIRCHLLEEHFGHLVGEPRVNGGPLGN